MARALFLCFSAVFFGQWSTGFSDSSGLRCYNCMDYNPDEAECKTIVTCNYMYDEDDACFTENRTHPNGATSILQGCKRLCSNVFQKSDDLITNITCCRSDLCNYVRGHGKSYHTSSPSWEYMYLLAILLIICTIFMAICWVITKIYKSGSSPRNICCESGSRHEERVERSNDVMTDIANVETFSPVPPPYMPEDTSPLPTYEEATKYNTVHTGYI